MSNDPLSIVTITYDRDSGEVACNPGELDWYSTLGLLNAAVAAVTDWLSGVNLVGIEEPEEESD